MPTAPTRPGFSWHTKGRALLPLAMGWAMCWLGCTRSPASPEMVALAERGAAVTAAVNPAAAAAPAAPVGAPEATTLPAVKNAEPCEWPLFRGNSLATGVASCSLPEKLVERWRFTVEKTAFETTAAIAQGLVFLADRDGVVYALKLADGSKLWEVSTGSSFLAPPAVKDGTVYLGDLDGRFYALEAATGKSRWVKEVGNEIDGGANFYKQWVLVGSQNATLYAFERATGTEAWKFTISDQIRCTPTVVENRAFVAGCDSKLHLVNLDTGQSAAQVPIHAPTGVTPAVRGNLVYLGTQGGLFFAIDWQKATVAWTYESDTTSVTYEGSPAVTASAVVTPHGKQVHALNPATGKELWSFTARGRVESSPVIFDSRVAFGSHDGRLYVLDLATGQERTVVELGGRILGSPAVAENCLVIATDRGVVHCLGGKP